MIVWSCICTHTSNSRPCQRHGKYNMMGCNTQGSRGSPICKQRWRNLHVSSALVGPNCVKTPRTGTLRSLFSVVSLSLSLWSYSAGTASPKMLARLAANRFREIRQAFRQVFPFPPHFLAFSRHIIHSPNRSLIASWSFLSSFWQPSRSFSTALNYVSSPLNFSHQIFSSVLMCVCVCLFIDWNWAFCKSNSILILQITTRTFPGSSAMPTKRRLVRMIHWFLSFPQFLCAKVWSMELNLIAQSLKLFSFLVILIVA